MITRRAVVLAALATPFVHAKTAPPAEVARELPAARRLGSGRLTWLGLPIYDAHLWVLEGFDAARFGALPLALELEYARALRGRKIAERSLDEMGRTGPIEPAQAEAWLAQLTRLLPDVAKSDRIVGVNRPGIGARFLLNGRVLGDVDDAEFARRFFGIWLAPQTSEPKLRRALLGGAPDTA